MDSTLSLSLLFLSTAIAAGTLASIALTRTAPGRRGLKRLADTPAPSRVTSPVNAILDHPPQTLDRFARAVGWTAEQIWAVDHTDVAVVEVAPGTAVRGGAGQARLARARRDLISAGYRSAAAAQAFLMVRVATPVVFALGGLLAGGFTTAALAAPVGLLAPELFLRRAIRQRQKAVRSALPDALDLMVICLEAGCTLSHAIAKTADELGFAHPVLADELRLVRAEMQTGKAKAEAFRRFAERTRLEEVRSVVAMLVQTDRFGTSIVQAMRAQASSLRTRRRQFAEERAAKAGIKLVFPLVFCFFPAFYVIALGPMIVQFIRLFFETLVPQLR